MRGCSARWTSARTASDAGTRLHVYPDYGWLRGFSIVPSWGARIEEAWWFYDGARMREEVALARQVHANCIRLWIEFTAWMADRQGDGELPRCRGGHRRGGNESDAVPVQPLARRLVGLRRHVHGDLYRDWQPQLDYVRALVRPLATDRAC